jgi:hypothetical protein
MNVSPPPAWCGLFFLVIPGADLAPSDFDVFGPLKDKLQGCCFAHQLQHSVHEERQPFSQQFYATTHAISHKSGKIMLLRNTVEI